MPTPQEILEAARVLRSYLPDLIGDEAEAVDAGLASAVAAQKPDMISAADIVELVRTDPRTRKWMDEYLDAEDENTRMAVLRTFSQPSGNPDPIPSQKYVCPIDCDTVWYRQFAGQDIPICETNGHKVRLVMATEATC